MELCIFLCCLVLFVRTLAKRLAGKRFPYNNQIEKLNIGIILRTVFSARNIFNFLNFLTATTFRKRNVLFV